MRISDHLTLHELTKSVTAYQLGIDNTPDDEAINNLRILASELFEPLRSKWDLPIFVSSGFRSLVLNKAIGGSKRSQHCCGRAIDIDNDNRNSIITNAMIFHAIKDEFDFDQLIWEYGDDENPAWVHVSYNKNNNRREVLKSFKDKGKTVYEKWE